MRTRRAEVPVPSTLYPMRDGTPRIGVLRPEDSGLRGAAFLWGEDLTRVSVLDLGQHIGWASEELVMQIKTHMRLNCADRHGLDAQKASA